MSIYTKLACFAGGALFGSFGVKLLSSKDAKKAYVHMTAGRAADEGFGHGNGDHRTGKRWGYSVLCQRAERGSRSKKKRKKPPLPIWKAKKPEIRRGSRQRLPLFEGGIHERNHLA